MPSDASYGTSRQSPKFLALRLFAIGPVDQTAMCFAVNFLIQGSSTKRDFVVTAPFVLDGFETMTIA